MNKFTDVLHVTVSVAITDQPDGSWRLGTVEVSPGHHGIGTMPMRLAEEVAQALADSGHFPVGRVKVREPYQQRAETVG